MLKSQFNSDLRLYSKTNLSPRKYEIDLVVDIYSEIQKALGRGNIRRVGSFARFTAITPVHDLDVVYIAGSKSDFVDQPLELLGDVAKRLVGHFNSTSYIFKLESIQTHSVSLSFPDNDFSIDVVPCYVWGKNEFDDPILLVPEILKTGKKHRQYIYADRRDRGVGIGWILSDPLGYREASRQLNELNPDYRKAAKLIKKWKHHSKGLNSIFPLKSFHLEQIIYSYFINNDITVFDALFNALTDMEEWISKPQIPDRADYSKMIDHYIEDLSTEEKETVLIARDTFLIEIEKHNASSTFFAYKSLYSRSPNEEFLFDQKIPTFTDSTLSLKIDGKVDWHITQYSYYLSSKNYEIVGVDRKVHFVTTSNNTNAYILKWKVKNSSNSPEKRGEISDHTTYKNPESTKYLGEHYVECYAIKDDICIKRAKIPVIIKQK